MYVCGNFRGKMAHQLMREKLRDLTSAASDSGQLVLPYHPKYYYEYMNREFVSLEKWWMERVVGEEGCWAIEAQEPEGSTSPS